MMHPNAHPSLRDKLPPLATGLRAVWREGYGMADLRRDLMAGLTVGTVAVPLSMALAIATGVPPQHGLYTAIVAGALIGILGGSRFSVSGPTAAFVVILMPIVHSYGLGGLLIASMMAGAILVLLGLTGMGRLIQFVPYPVVLGFTAGIALVIALLQVPDFLGLSLPESGAHFLQNLWLIVRHLVEVDVAEFAVGGLTLLVLLLWPRLRLPVPAPLVGLLAGALAAWALNGGWLIDGVSVDTIASRFTWAADGREGLGIPPIPPVFAWPWQWPGAGGEPLAFNFDLIRALLGPAFAIALLGAIESLLCAVVADGLTRTRHEPNTELIAQGVGNLVAPLFGGITATAALARTATNIRSGARSPVAAVVHALVVLLAVVALAGLLGRVPMAALAALLFVVAWNMSEARHFWHTLRFASRGDVILLLVCFGLTVVFDMVLAVSVGVALAGILFIRRMALMTHLDRLANSLPGADHDLPAPVAVYRVSGPLFFGVAEKALSALHRVAPDIRVVILDLSQVQSLDATSVVALRSLATGLQGRGVALILTGLPTRIIVKLLRAGLHRTEKSLAYRSSVLRAQTLAERWLAAP